MILVLNRSFIVVICQFSKSFLARIRTLMHQKIRFLNDNCEKKFSVKNDVFCCLKWTICSRWLFLVKLLGLKYIWDFLWPFIFHFDIFTAFNSMGSSRVSHCVKFNSAAGTLTPSGVMSSKNDFETVKRLASLHYALI